MPADGRPKTLSHLLLNRPLWVLMRWRLAFRAVVSLFLLGAACGGRSIRHDEGGEAGQDPGDVGGVGGNTGGTGGSGTLGGTGVGAYGGTGGSAGGEPVSPPKFCDFNGLVLSVGQSTEDPLLCRTCTCQPDGDVDCTHCDATCRVASATIAVGENLLMPDGCTSCLCTVEGMDCNSNQCVTPDPCRDLATEYELAVGAARWCGQVYGDYTCNAAIRVPESIPCGCLVVVRGNATTTPIADRYFEMGCPADPRCERTCDEPRPPYRCGEAGFCVGAI